MHPEPDQNIANKEGAMDTSPRILMWGFSSEEKDRFDTFLKEICASPTVQIEPDQGPLPVHEILFSDKRAEEMFISDQKVLLFFNVPAEVIHGIMAGAKKKDLPRPIYAMVTKENIEWSFSDLVEHLTKEHEFMQKKLKERREGKH